jgi:hypothetical protein
LLSQAMAYSEHFIAPYSGTQSPTRAIPQRTSSCQKSEVVNEREVMQGRILWLPMRDELPEKAVRRAHGKGAVEEGVYNHPVVIISRPEDNAGVVHFHVVSNSSRAPGRTRLKSTRSPLSRVKSSTRSTQKRTSFTQAAGPGTYPLPRHLRILMPTRRRRKRGSPR